MGKGHGGGGLRILPHKSWHVWNANNMERVLRDEADHEAEEEEKAKEAREAASLQRTDVMRARSRKKLKRTAEEEGVSLNELFVETGSLQPETQTMQLPPPSSPKLSLEGAGSSVRSNERQHKRRRGEIAVSDAPMTVEGGEHEAGAQEEEGRMLAAPGFLNLFAEEEAQAKVNNHTVMMYTL
jgi:hypothetical protein